MSLRLPVRVRVVSKSGVTCVCEIAYLRLDVRVRVCLRQ